MAKLTLIKKTHLFGSLLRVLIGLSIIVIVGNSDAWAGWPPEKQVRDRRAGPGVGF